ncbi:MAG: hypothetical protein EHM20_10165 [Alphaproteobacteria bacterium]|nr:MAG: hypothetical protein EHM20_10165 [Alphaproteobacteria bacterium]
MATIDDQASDFEAMFLKEAMEHRKIVPLKTGYCLNCLEKVNNHYSYCCPECREDHGKRVAFSKGVIQA